MNVLLLIYVLFFMYYLRKCIVSQYRIEDNKLIFYPNNFKQGYLATEEQINQVKKSFKKIYFLNVLGYKKDVEKVFANSQKILIPLNRKVYRNNLAKVTNWFEILFLLLMNTLLIMHRYQDKMFVFVILICTFVFIGNIVITKFKLKQVS